jgi:hypothetical protein
MPLITVNGGFTIQYKNETASEGRIAATERNRSHVMNSLNDVNAHSNGPWSWMTLADYVYLENKV